MFRIITYLYLRNVHVIIKDIWSNLDAAFVISATLHLVFNELLSALRCTGN